MDGPAATIIVPVHNAYDVLDSCLAALLESIPANTPVLLIDDASTDPAVLPLLVEFTARAGPGWRLIRQESNRGFVATANLGMRSCATDVILLNSDTLPAGEWFEQLCTCASVVEGLATATPWTNNGEIVSLPGFCQANPLPADRQKLAAVLARDVTPAYPELPTAVGFCMYLTRQAMDMLGAFDEETFGHGYGEENDFSMRAAAAGLRNVLCDTAWVGHIGNQSFGPMGLQPNDLSMGRLLAKHPHYREIIAAYIDADPLQERRREIIAALEHGGVALN
jgi:GT2 family glycosyltransferase